MKIRISLGLVLSSLVAGLLLLPKSGDGCMPIWWQSEVASLTLESIVIEGVEIAPPEIYLESELEIRVSPDDGSSLWLQATRDSLPIYFARFR